MLPPRLYKMRELLICSWYPLFAHEAIIIDEMNDGNTECPSFIACKRNIRVSLIVLWCLLVRFKNLRSLSHIRAPGRSLCNRSSHWIGKILPLHTISPVVWAFSTGILAFAHVIGLERSCQLSTITTPRRTFRDVGYCCSPPHRHFAICKEWLYVCWLQLNVGSFSQWSCRGDKLRRKRSIHFTGNFYPSPIRPHSYTRVVYLCRNIQSNIFQWRYCSSRGSVWSSWRLRRCVRRWLQRTYPPHSFASV